MEPSLFLGSAARRGGAVRRARSARSWAERVGTTECTASASERTSATGPSVGAARPGDLRDQRAPHHHRVGVLGEARACSGAEMPKPTATGAALAARTASSRAGRSAGSVARAPVTPVTLTK